jgi:hypothetical protein
MAMLDWASEWPSRRPSIFAVFNRFQPDIFLQFDDIANALIFGAPQLFAAMPSEATLVAEPAEILGARLAQFPRTMEAANMLGAKRGRRLARCLALDLFWPAR